MFPCFGSSSNSSPCSSTHCAVRGRKIQEEKDVKEAVAILDATLPPSGLLVRADAYHLDCPPGRHLCSKCLPENDSAKHYRQCRNSKFASAFTYLEKCQICCIDYNFDLSWHLGRLSPCHSLRGGLISQHNFRQFFTSLFDPSTFYPLVLLQSNWNLQIILQLEANSPFGGCSFSVTRYLRSFRHLRPFRIIRSSTVMIHLYFGRFSNRRLFKPFSGHYSSHFSEIYSKIPFDIPKFSLPIMSLPEKKAALKRAKDDLAQAERRHSRRPTPAVPNRPRHPLVLPANRSPIRRPTRPAPPLSPHRRRQPSPSPAPVCPVMRSSTPSPPNRPLARRRQLSPSPAPVCPVMRSSTPSPPNRPLARRRQLSPSPVRSARRQSTPSPPRRPPSVSPRRPAVPPSSVGPPPPKKRFSSGQLRTLLCQKIGQYAMEG
ncbi:hypothetical protein niasHT_025091 [Heterodera trifolii]|uniref:Uncharacterized protein n=1 Tax=Heterodera trifolii TaxID=157864 RepID=A0ABD2K105_9BILA